MVVTVKVVVIQSNQDDGAKNRWMVSLQHSAALLVEKLCSYSRGYYYDHLVWWWCYFSGRLEVVMMIDLPARIVKT